MKTFKLEINDVKGHSTVFTHEDLLQFWRGFLKSEKIPLKMSSGLSLET